ncbi:conserved unknown protein [Ectocarpus siliculosus]|uniref:Uncharacterized protein n=1 Tax=Ectocarpus siliculosus TaxID=2880 RepID=D7G885_ECTSI|nr:conserved unknown protein [Ectocarpus siliculosus]|eukprot:CBJ34022.1 conserved unknown protein [Ectocarpus siliculosus]
MSSRSGPYKRRFPPPHAPPLAAVLPSDYYSVENGRGDGPGKGADKGSCTSAGSTGTKKSVIEAGEVAGDYSLDWKGTFDMTLVQVTVAWLAVNIGLTLWIKPTLFHNAEFWVLQVPKLAFMIVVSILAGSLCRHFCPADDTGYIMTSKNSWFKARTMLCSP